MAQMKTYSKKTELLYAAIDSLDTINDAIKNNKEIQSNKPLRLRLFTTAGIFLGTPKYFTDQEINNAEIISFNKDKTSFKINMAYLIKARNKTIEETPDDYTTIGLGDTIYLEDVEYTTNNGDIISMPSTYVFVDSVVSFLIDNQ